MIDFDYDEHEALAKFLGLSIDEITCWSDGTFTVGKDYRFEYIVLENKKDGYMEFLGIQDGFYIYKN